jgi:hypothetical protein
MKTNTFSENVFRTIFMTSGKGHLCLKYLTLSKTFNVMLNISNTNDLFHNHHLMLCAIILQLIDWTYMFLKPEGYFIYFMLILLRPFILKKKWRINEMVSINLNQNLHSRNLNKKYELLKYLWWSFKTIFETDYFLF